MVLYSLLLITLVMASTRNFAQSKETCTEKAVDQFTAIFKKYVNDSHSSSNLINEVRNITKKLSGEIGSVSSNIKNSTEKRFGSLEERLGKVEESVSAMTSNVDAFMTHVARAVTLLQEKKNTVAGCEELLAQGQTRPGVYAVNIEDIGIRKVYCDRGYTTFQRRESGNENFDRTLSDYAIGFGYPNHDHWLGLEILHVMTRRRHCKFRAEIDIDRISGFEHIKKQLKDTPEDYDDETKIVEYSKFYVGPKDKFRLSLLGGSGNVKDKKSYNGYMMKSSIGQAFMAKDSYGPGQGTNCAKANAVGGGWWYGPLCGPVAPNSFASVGGTCYPGNHVCILWTPFFARGVQLKLRC